MIELGFFVKDKVTGVVGIAENRATFLFGCDRYCVQPQIKEDGTIPDSLMIDEPQLEVLKDKERATGWICGPRIYKFNGWVFKDLCLRKRAGRKFWEMFDKWDELCKADQEEFRIGGGCQRF